MLNLVGENITKYRARYAALSGRLRRLADGAYIPVGQDPVEAARRYALSLAKYYFRSTYLTHASAYYEGPTPDGKLYLGGGSGNLRKTLPGLDIIVSTAKAHPQVLTSFSKDEDERPVVMKRASDALLFLQMFQRARLHDKKLPPPVLKAFAHTKTAPSFAQELRAVAQTQGMNEELARALHFLDTLEAPPMATRQEDRFVVAWYGRPIADLYHHNGAWRYEYRPGWVLPLSFAEDRPGVIPLFLQSLLPEGWLLDVTGKRKEVDFLRGGYRYLSNITIAEDEETLKSLPIDKLRGSLARWSKSGVFSGTVDNSLADRKAEFETRMAQMWDQRTMPRLSGVQLKIPVTLDDDGRLYTADKTPFTHILKVGLPNRYPEIGLVEWACMQTLGELDIPTAKTALVGVPGLPPACLVERFDIRGEDDDSRLICTEDIASALSIYTAQKYDVSSEHAAKAILDRSTARDQDAAFLLKQFFAAWLMGNGDLHVKNLSFLKVANATLDRYEIVNLTPAYDMLCTKVFLSKDQLALPLGGKRDNLNDKTWMNFAAAPLRLPAREAREAIGSVLASFVRFFDAVVADVPAFVKSEANEKALGIVRDVVQERISAVPTLAKEAGLKL